MKFLIPFALTLCVISQTTFPSLAAADAPAASASSASEEAAPSTARALPIVWNGNLCEPDSIRLCLGVQGKGRDAWVNCMRDHYDQLTLDCQQVMAPSNFKSDAPAPTEVRSDNHAAGY